jgi:hypothetical protein
MQINFLNSSQNVMELCSWSHYKFAKEESTSEKIFINKKSEKHTFVSNKKKIVNLIVKDRNA